MAHGPHNPTRKTVETPDACRGLVPWEECTDQIASIRRTDHNSCLEPRWRQTAIIDMEAGFCLRSASHRQEVRMARILLGSNSPSRAWSLDQL